MTNVPDIIREAIAEAYKVFDASYRMNGTNDEWMQYWNSAKDVVNRYNGIPLVDLFEGYAKIIEKAVEKRKEDGNTLSWNPDEDYPYPKE